jgi:hypothetical protein
MSALYPTFHVASWVNPITVHSGGADFSVFTGMAAGALVYLVLAGAQVRREAVDQDRLLATDSSSPSV